MSQPIGYVTPVNAPSGRFTAECAESGCRWTITKATQAEAEQSLRGHALTAHPKPIPVYPA